MSLEMFVNHIEGQGSSQSPISVAETGQTVCVCVCVISTLVTQTHSKHSIPTEQWAVTERLGHLCQSSLLFSLFF